MSSDSDCPDDDWLYSIRTNDLVEARRLLRDRLVSNLNAKDENGNTALHYACANNLEVAVVFLLQHCKLDYDICNSSGNTPLHWAIQTNSLKAAKVLLLHDYHVHEAKYRQQTACDYFQELAYPTLPHELNLDFETLQHYNIVQYDSEYAARNNVDLLRKNAFGKSPLNDAFNCKDINLLQLILEHPSAAILEKSEGEDEAACKPHKSVIHKFRFGGEGSPIVEMRELAICEGVDVLNAVDAELDVSGNIVWDTALVASQWLSHLAVKGKFQDTRVLELGAGCGLLGISVAVFSNYCHKLPKQLLLSDCNDETLTNLKYNIQLNNLDQQPFFGTLKLDWNNSNTWPGLSEQKEVGNDHFDIIIGSDLVYDSLMVEPLTNVICSLLGPCGEFLYCFKTNRAGADLLPEALRKANFIVEIEPAPTEFLSNPLESREALETFFPDFKSDDIMIAHAYRAQPPQ